MGGTEIRTLRVQQKAWEADGVTSVTFVDPAGAPLPTWTPGSHVALRLPGGLVREYSLCSNPSDRARWTVAVLRTPDTRGGSRYVHERLMIGEEIEVEGPRDNFAIDADATHHQLVAGGVGITPIIAMVRELERQGADWSLLYTGRSRAHMAFLDELSALPGGRVTVHADDEADGAYPDLASFLGNATAGTTAYCCGPEPLMDACAAALPDPSWLRVERFRAPEPMAPSEEDAAFDVVLARSGQRVPVAPDTSVLKALLDAGVDVPSSCTEGICGTCEVGVVKGDVDHRDYLLSPEEHTANTTMFVCVSRCRSAELVLDL